MKINRTTVIGAVVVLVGAGGWAGAQRVGSHDEAVAAPVVDTVGQRDLVVTSDASGTVQPVRTVEVKSKASGGVLQVYVESGDVVKAGTLLAEIDPRDVQNALDQAEADIESARVQLATASAQKARMEALKKANAATEEEYESAVQAAASARASVVRAETNLQLARDRRNDVTIRAPIDGTILTRAVEPGQIIASATSNVSGGTTLFTMADLSEMQVSALVDETDIGKIEPGQTVHVTVEAYPNRRFTGEVQKIEPQAVVDQNVTMFPVLVNLANPEGLLKSGMNADVSVQIANREGAVAVPNSAVSTLRTASAAAEALGLDPSTVRPNREGGWRRGANGNGNRSGGPGSGPRGAGFSGRGSQGGSGARPAGGAHPGIVFVQGASGPEPRRVMLGLSDWEYTEVLSGLKAGEKVYEVTGAQLLQQQSQMQDRIRERSGGPIPGARGGRRR